MSLGWGQIFGISVSPLELIIRGTAMYLFLFLLFRVVVRRRVWLNFHVPALRPWLEPPPMLLIQNGRILHRNLGVRDGG